MSGNFLGVGFSAKIEGSSLETILASGKSRIIDDLEDYFRRHPLSKSTEAALKDGIRSSLTLPLKAGGQIVGAVFFSSGKKNTYENRHVEQFAKVADEISLLIQFGRLSDFFERNRSREQFLRSTLHDLRSPLGVIQGMIEILKSESWYHDLDGQSKSLVEGLLRNAKYMGDLLSDLAEINLLNTPSSSIETEEVNLSKFLMELSRDARVMVAKKGMLFTAPLYPPASSVWTFDPIRIRQVLDNLITNAIKFSSPGSTIEVGVEILPEKLSFFVKDTGQGIPVAEIPKLFQDFSRTSVRPTGGESSTGLGLAIARRIVQAHGGQIDAKSTLGVGSTFSFWLPKIQSA